MTDGEWENMGGCVIDQNQNEFCYGVDNQESNIYEENISDVQNEGVDPFGSQNRQVISIVVNEKDDTLGLRRTGSKSRIGITIDVNEDGLRKRGKSGNEIKIDLTLDDNPFGIRIRGRKNLHRININRNVDDDPFGMRKRGRESGQRITINLNPDDDPFGLRKRATNHDDDPFGLSNRAPNHDDDPFGLRNRPKKSAHGLKRNEFDNDFNDGQRGFGLPDTCVYDQEECNTGEYIRVGMIIDTLEESELLYNAHTKITGYSIRRVDKRRNCKGAVTLRRWVCAKEGHRQIDDFERLDRRREPRPITRVGCLASFIVKLDKNLKKYVVKHFNVEHNHSLQKFDDTQFLRSHRSVGLADKAQIKGMLSVGVKPAQIMDYFVKQSGGYKYVGFTSKDLANYIKVIRQEVLNVGDAQSTLTYLQAKKDSDPMFFYSYDEDDKKRLTNLFWADGRSRADYACFGDVIAFDSTYKTNAYQKQLVIFVGVNHHHHSTIFGCALLVDETVKTYCWVLNTFLAAMGNKIPVSVLTDGDKAMRNAIQNCFPGTRHRLCSWHLHKNSMTNVNGEQGFCREFQTCMATWYTREEFDAAWNDIIVRYKLQNNEWVADTYANRELWAEAYLRGVFFAGTRSTQRCEGMNSYLNRFLHTQLKMFEVVRQFERGHARMRQKGDLAEFESKHGSQILTTALQSLEKHGAEIYTKQSFKKFRNELKHESLYSIVDKANNASGVTYLLGKYCDDSSNNVVTYEKTNSELHCSCQRFKSNGIPCRHILAVVKAENMETIPECCITRRWCKNARSEMGELVGQTV